MATISGYLRFDQTRSAVSSATLAGIAHVPIVLQNTANGRMLAVYTDANGMYTFTNVPDGTYRIVEAYGTPAAVSPGDFSSAAAAAPVSAAFPPVSYVVSPPSGATHLDGVTPTTRLVTVSGSNLVNQDFLNGPVKYTPIQTILDTGVTILPGNLITRADNGTFGFFPQGTAANTGAIPNPYPDIGTHFAYVQPNPNGVNPGGGQYTIQNIVNNATATVQNSWWRVADHTTGNETGRMMLINGDFPGKILFQQKVSVKPDTYYLLSAWILNLSKSAALTDPQVGVQVLDGNGQVLYNATLGALIPRNEDTPEWKQIGTIINSKGNTSLTVRFTSMGPETVGNDYAIDDISLNEVKVVAYAPHKSADTTVAQVGDVVTYTITLNNTGANRLTNLSVRDVVPDGFTLVPGSVTINGTPNTAVNPGSGFTAPDIPGGGTLTVTFRAVADFIPSVNPTINQAKVSYNYTPVVGGIQDSYTTTSNAVTIPIEAARADLSVSKTSDQTTVTAGSVLTYTVTVVNHGPDVARDVLIMDTLPSGLLSPEYSADGGITWQPFNGIYVPHTVDPGASASILVRGMVSGAASGVLTNTAAVVSSTKDPNFNNNSAAILTPITQLADLSIQKTGTPSPVQDGDRLTYTLTATNSGPNTAQDITLTDRLPSELQNQEYSTDGGRTWNPWQGAYSLKSLTPGSSASILVRGRVSAGTSGMVKNTATVSSSTSDPNPNNNSDTIITPVTVSADLSISKTGIPVAVLAGNQLTYTLEVRNNGPNTAQDITISDPAPSGLLSPEYSVDGGATWQPWTGTYSLRTLAPGDAASVLIRGTVSGLAAGVVTNTATVSSPVTDPNPDNNSDTTITSVISEADVSLAKTADPSPVHAGNTVVYTLTASNHGPGNARNVVISDTLPDVVQNPEYSVDGGVTWQPFTGSYTQSSLAPDTAVSILIRGTVEAGATGVMENTADVTGSNPDPNPDNNRVTITTPLNAAADLILRKTADQNPVQSGNTLTYTMRIINNGPDPAADVVLSDPVPADLLAPEYSADGGVTWQPWTGSLDLGTVAPGSESDVLIRGTVNPSATGVVRNAARVSASTPDPVQRNNQVTVVTPINTSADLTVQKMADPSPVQAGSQLTYTLSAHNNGPNEALAVTFTDTPPAGLLDPEYSTDGGMTWQPWTGEYVMDSLAAGADGVILLRGTVSNAASGTLVNAAAVSSLTPDPDPDNNTGTSNTPVTAFADLELIKTADPSPVRPGDRLTYILKAVNHGPNDARDVTVFDNIPLSLPDAQYSVDGGVTWRQWRGGYSLAGLPAGASATIMIRGTVSGQAAGVITNTATVTSPTSDPNPDNNSDTTLTPVTTNADLMLTKTGIPDSVQIGDLLTYTVRVINNGPDIARDATLTDSIPEGLVTPEYSTDGGVTWQPWTGSYSLGSLSPGADVTVLIRGSVSGSASGVLANTAAVTSLTPDTDHDNNSDTVLTPVQILADLSVIKTAPSSPVQTGDLLTYTLTAANNGPNDAKDVMVFDRSPSGLEDVQYSVDGGITWQQWRGAFTFSDLAAGSSADILIRGRVSRSDDGVLVNTAAVSSPTDDPNADNNSHVVFTPVQTAADLTVTKTASPDTVLAGTVLTYTLTAVNHGPDPAKDVTLTDTLPDTLLSPEYSADGGVTWQPWNGFAAFDTLAPGASGSIRIRGTVSPDALDSIINTAVVTGSTPDPNPENNQVSVHTPVQAAADVSLEKTVNADRAEAGDVLIYTLTAVNHGPGTAQNVTVTDRLSAGLTGEEYSTDGGNTWEPWPGFYTYDRIQPGRQGVLFIRGTVGDTTAGMMTGQLVNRADVNSTTPDPNADNNQVTVTTPVLPPADGCPGLSITKTVCPERVSPCDFVTYTIRITNTGQAAAEKVVLYDTVPEDIRNVHYSMDDGNTWYQWSGGMELGTVLPCDAITILLKGVMGYYGACSITNCAHVVYADCCDVPGQNRATATVSVCSGNERTKYRWKDQ